MKIYLDYVFFMNFLFDLILIYGTSIILKRNASLKRIILASIFGGLSTFILLINMPYFIYFFMKLFLGIIIVIIAFKYKDLKYTFLNFFYLMILSIIVGGFLYFINIEFGYEHTGMVFFTNGKNISTLILMLLAILITFIYAKIINNEQKERRVRYKVDIFFNNKVLHLNGFLDTGNHLCDPLTKKPVLIVNKNINISFEKFIFVPFHTLNSKGVLKCFIVPKIFIEDIGYKKNVLIGVSSDKFLLSGVDIILHIDIMEGNND